MHVLAFQQLIKNFTTLEIHINCLHSSDIMHTFPLRGVLKFCRSNLKWSDKLQFWPDNVRYQTVNLSTDGRVTKSLGVASLLVRDSTCQHKVEEKLGGGGGGAKLISLCSGLS